MLAELENISYYVQTPGHNKRFSGHNSGGIQHSCGIPAFHDEKTGKNRPISKLPIPSIIVEDPMY